MNVRVLGCLLGALFLAGCGRKPPPDQPAPEIRGEPIRSAPTVVAGSAGGVTGAASPLPVGGVAPETTGAVASAAANVETKTQDLKLTAGGAYPLVGFDKLSGYAIEISDEILGPVTNNLEAIAAKTEAMIPRNVKAFDRQHASIKGFMLPLKVEGGVVTELLIMKDQSMCCYGAVPKIHEWVSVKMTGPGVKPIMDQPVTLFGTLRVGEMRENGYLVGIYSMDGERMQGPDAD
jgi:hypothetical protein